MGTPTAIPGPDARPVLSEAQLHKACAKFLNAVLPPEVIFTTIGHGGGGKVRGAQLKAMGVKRGVPDVMICWDDGEYSPGVMWLELKSEKGRLSPEQVAFMWRAENLGHTCYVCRNLDDVAQALIVHRVPHRISGGIDVEIVRR